MEWFSFGALSEPNELDQQLRLNVLAIYLLDDLSIGATIECMWESATSDETVPEVTAEMQFIARFDVVMTPTNEKVITNADLNETGMMKNSRFEIHRLPLDRHRPLLLRLDRRSIERDQD